jgi:hypothetical protein
MAKTLGKYSKVIATLREAFIAETGDDMSREIAQNIVDTLIDELDAPELIKYDEPFPEEEDEGDDY